jgi:hypothetical protein
MMAPLHLSPMLSVALSLLLSTTPFLTNAQNITIPTLSTWDLFKNSQLQPCISNITQQAVQHVDKRLAQFGSSPTDFPSFPSLPAFASFLPPTTALSPSATHHSSSTRTSSSPTPTITQHSYGNSAYLVSGLVYEAWVKRGSNAYCKSVNFTQMPVRTLRSMKYSD